MRVGDWHALIGPALAAAVLLAAALLGMRQRAERRARAAVLEDPDRRHFARQDARRRTGTVVLALAGLGIAWGSGIDPKGDERSKRLFLAVWLAVMLLVLVLMVLAFLDVLATQLYARRHRRALAAERRRVLKDWFKPRRSSPWPGPDGEAHPNGPTSG
jgi:cytochrome c oxidase assembly factor CtaG